MKRILIAALLGLVATPALAQQPPAEEPQVEFEVIDACDYYWSIADRLEKIAELIDQFGSNLGLRHAADPDRDWSEEWSEFWSFRDQNGLLERRNFARFVAARCGDVPGT